MLEEWTAASRDRFTCADFDFLNEVLAGGEKRVCMAKLWEDPDALREMLDLKRVLRGVLDSTAALRVSPAFYFYVLIRHAFKQSGITDPEMADYVSHVIARRLSVQKDDPLHDIANGYTHASDFLAVISPAQGRMKFHLQVAAGNQFMVRHRAVSGLHQAPQRALRSAGSRLLRILRPAFLPRRRGQQLPQWKDSAAFLRKSRRGHA